MTFSNIPVIFLIKTPREMVWRCVGDDVPPPLLTDKLVMVRGKCSARLPPARSPGLTGQQSRGFPSTFSNLRTLRLGRLGSLSPVEIAIVTRLSMEVWRE